MNLTKKQKNEELQENKNSVKQPDIDWQSFWNSNDLARDTILTSDQTQDDVYQEESSGPFIYDDTAFQEFINDDIPEQQAATKRSSLFAGKSKDKPPKFKKTKDKKSGLKKDPSKRFKDKQAKNKKARTKHDKNNKENVRGGFFKRHRRLKKVGIVVLALAMLYSVVAFSDIPFIAKWRTIYIETAMSTYSHHWLATAFFPPSVIDKALHGFNTLDAAQSGLFSNWNISKKGNTSLPWGKQQDKFFKVYSEIDKQSFQDYADKHQDAMINDNNYLMIDKAGLNDGGTSIKTVHGDQVLAIDTVNGITIVKVAGEGYVGRLAIIKDPSKVDIGLAKDLGSNGQTVGDLAKSNNAVLAINASGFFDPNGQGNGGTPYGLVMSGGKTYSKTIGGTFKTIAFDKDDKLNIGSFDSNANFRDACEFKPILVLNGKKTVSGSAGWGIQPRSAIGQNKDGEVLLLVVDGRQPGYSIGCTMEDLADVLMRYGAVQACNLDGGSSSLMYYNGREISKPSASNKKVGRRVPNGFVVFNK